MGLLGGTKTHPMDGKGRVSFPSKLSKELHGDLVLSYIPDTDFPNLSVFEKDEFVKWVDAYFESKGGFDYQSGEDDYLYDEMYNNCEPMTIDQQGRILISPKMREYAHLKLGGHVVIAGSGKRIKIWDPEIYEKRAKTYRNTSTLQHH